MTRPIARTLAPLVAPVLTPLLAAGLLAGVAGCDNNYSNKQTDESGIRMKGPAADDPAAPMKPQPAAPDSGGMKGGMSGGMDNGMNSGGTEMTVGQPQTQMKADAMTGPATKMDGMGDMAETATATIKPAPATKALAATRPSVDKTAGTVTLTDDGKGGVHVHAELTGLAPGSVHGFHIHEKGDLSAPDFSSAGGHFNPTNKPHGAPGPDTHVGDLGNITADADGHGTLDVDTPDATVKELIGKAIIVHGYPDDLKSQPSGNADGRIAGGVIKAGM